MANNTSEKHKSITLIPPKGILKYPKLREVDYGTDKYPIPEGVYQTQLILNKADQGVEAFLAKRDDLMEQSKWEAEEQLAEMSVKSRKDIEVKGGLSAFKAYSEIYDDETEEPTGEVEVKIKKRATFKKKDGSKEIAAPPPLFDSDTPPKLLPKKVEVWGGTQAVINIGASPYFMNTDSYGVSLRLNAVQIIKLVDSGGAKDAASYGFEGLEDGWSSSEMDADEPVDGSTDATVEEDIDDEADF